MSVDQGFLDKVMTPDGKVSATLLAQVLDVTKKQLAKASGLSPDAVSKKARVESRATQKRLRDMVEIINRVLPWSGSVGQAYAWYRCQPIPSFGDVTAEYLVKTDMAEAVKEYLERIAIGGYA